MSQPADLREAHGEIQTQCQHEPDTEPDSAAPEEEVVERTGLTPESKP